MNIEGVQGRETSQRDLQSPPCRRDRDEVVGLVEGGESQRLQLCDFGEVCASVRADRGLEEDSEGETRGKTEGGLLQCYGEF